jgi:hypothetical protein
MTIGTLLSPLLGGVIYKGCGYYAVFGLAFELVGVDVALRFTMLERKELREKSDAEDGVLQQSSMTASCDELAKGLMWVTRNQPLLKRSQRAAKFDAQSW